MSDRTTIGLNSTSTSPANLAPFGRKFCVSRQVYKLALANARRIHAGILDIAEHAFRVMAETQKSFCPKSPCEHAEFIGQGVSNRVDGYKARTLGKVARVHCGAH